MIRRAGCPWIAGAMGLALAAAAIGCGGGPPRYGPRPEAPVEPSPEPPPASREDVRPKRGDVPVRIGLRWEPGRFRIRASSGALVLETADGSSPRAGQEITLVADGTRIEESGSRGLLGPGTESLRVAAEEGSRIFAGERLVRGTLEISARNDSLFVVNCLPLEEYLRGVVPREIGGKSRADLAAVAAQAVAARTYTVKRIGQYNSLPFDVYASVQDQVYEGIAAETPLADEAVRATRGLILSSGDHLLETFYSSTCGGWGGDIATVWPHRERDEALRGGPDGPAEHPWCRGSPHFSWTESWKGAALSTLVRRYLPTALEARPGSVQGELVDVRITRQDASGRAAEMEYVTTKGRWRVPGDKNRWILRRPDGGILRSTRIELEVTRERDRVRFVQVRGKGNGHGVGMCQVGALARSRAGQGFREILSSYYPGAAVRPLDGSDLRRGRSGAS